MVYRNRKLLDIAQGMPCVMCGNEDGTGCAAHSNLLEHGKGRGLKAHDGMTAWLCYNCHSEYDQGNKMSREEKRDFILTAICKTYMQLWDGDIIKIA
jgi:hypothetical protein